MAKHIPLCTSHLLPAAISRWISKHSRGTAHPNPIYVTPRIALESNFQVAEHLLCTNCEERLNKGGETWLLRNIYRGNGHFRLQANLRNCPVRGVTRDGLLADARSHPEIDVGKLVYFAISVFWRAGAHRWHALDHSGQSRLGPYREAFRRYLLHEDGLPDRTSLIVYVSNGPKPDLGAIYPLAGRLSGLWQHIYMIPGVGFWLHLGQIPDELKVACILRTGCAILTEKLDGTIASQMACLLHTAKPSGRLASS